MKIRLSHLRKLIRETIEEQGWVPGRWYPGDGEPVDPDDVKLMGTGGLGDELEEEEGINEANLTVKRLKKSDYASVQKMFPKFIRRLVDKFGDEYVTSSSFAVSPQGLMGVGKVPLMAPQNVNDPIVYWEDESLKYNSSISLADAMRSAR